MNELQVFTSEQLNEIKDLEKSKSSDYIGFFYVLEWNENVKIGCTAKPYKRMKQLKIVANYAKVKIGMVAISQGHTNYRDNEKLLHSHFKHFRLESTELFDISFENAILNMPNNLTFLDESEYFQQCAIEGCKKLEKLCMGTSENNLNEYDEQLLGIAQIDARVDMSEILMELSCLDVFSAEGKSVLLAKAAEILIGEPIIPPSAFRDKN